MIRSVAGKRQAFAVALDDARERPRFGDDQFVFEYGRVRASAWPIFITWRSTNRYSTGLWTQAALFYRVPPMPLAALATEAFEKVCFIGSGALQGVAVESALKASELTAGRIFNLSESILGLRHGPMAALDETTLLVAFLSSEERVGLYERDLLQEIARKGIVKTKIAVGGHSELPLDGFADRYLSPDIRTAVPDDCRPPVDILFGQLLGLFFSLRCGLMPDRPSPGGVISRVVQNVKIYS